MCCLSTVSLKTITDQIHILMNRVTHLHSLNYSCCLYRSGHEHSTCPIALAHTGQGTNILLVLSPWLLIQVRARTFHLSYHPGCSYRSGHEHSTCPIALMSSFGCRMSGNIEIWKCFSCFYHTL